MKKGELRREQILEGAAALFDEVGYEETSLQDILDRLNLSKGGFYHYFESKLALMEAICDVCGERCGERAREALERCAPDVISRLNTVLGLAGIWRESDPHGVTERLRIENMAAGQDRFSLLRLQREREALLPWLNAVIAEGIRQDLFYLPHSEMAGELILRLCGMLSGDFVRMMRHPERRSEGFPRAILSRLELYRHAVERILGAPFGTVVICEFGNLQEAAVSVPDA